jgi:hypothetical protein
MIWRPCYCFRRFGISFHGRRAPSGTGHPNCRSFSNTNTTHSVGFLWTCDQPDKQTSYWHKKRSENTDIKLPAGFEISKRPGADLLLEIVRPLGSAPLIVKRTWITAVDESHVSFDWLERHLFSRGWKSISSFQGPRSSEEPSLRNTF